MHKNEVDLPIFVRWMEFMQVLGQVIERMPKKMRYTICDRVYNLALDIAERLVEARYSKHKAPVLAQANVLLDKIRIVIRVAYDAKYVCAKDFYRLNTDLFEVGKMVGGWRRDVAVRNATS